MTAEMFVEAVPAPAVTMKASKPEVVEVPPMCTPWPSFRFQSPTKVMTTDRRNMSQELHIVQKGC